MFWKWYKVFVGLAILALAFVMNYVHIDDPDIWWHIKCGELLFTKGWILHEDIFSYTANGKPWVDGYLIAQWIFYLAWRLDGVGGVCLLGALLTASTYGVALAISRRSGPGFIAALAVSIPAIFVSRDALSPRPVLFTPLFMLLWIWLLRNHQERGGRQIYWLPLLMVLWTNCHPGFPLGIIITGIYLLAAIREPTLRKRFAIIMVAQFAATFVNPYGYNIFYSAFSFFSDPRLKWVINEWLPLYGAPKNSIDILPSFFVIIAAWTSCVLYGLKRVRLENILLFLFTTVSSILWRRNLIYFGPLSVALIALTVENTVADRIGQTEWPFPAFFKTAKSVVAAILAGAALFLLWFTATNRLYFHTAEGGFRTTGAGFDSFNIPTGAADFLKRERIAGNVFNTFNIGGYLIFALYPDYKVFIDGRVYPYDYDTFVLAQDGPASGSRFRRMQEEYDIRAIVFPLSQRYISPLIALYMKKSDWAVVHADEAGVVFLQRNAGNDPIIERNELNLLKEPPRLNNPPPGREYHLWSSAEYPAGAIHWAKIYQQIGRPDLAASVLKPTLNYRPVPAGTEAWIGNLLIQSGNLEEGIGLTREALRNNPDDLTALRGLAYYYLLKGDYERAESAIMHALELNPGTSSLWNALGEISLARGDFPKAAERFRKAIEFDPTQASYWEKLGMSLRTTDAPGAIEAFNKAMELYEEAGADQKDIARVRKFLSTLKAIP